MSVPLSMRESFPTLDTLMTTGTVNHPTVLVVDDDPIALEAIKARLEGLGCTVVVRDRSLGTSQWILENQPDIVLLDVMMPALSGGELARMLRDRAASVGVILHSSKPQKEIDELVTQTGALGGIPKGLSEAAFARRFERLLRRSRTRSAPGRD